MVVGIVLLVVGFVGLVSNFSVFLMWTLVIAGAIGILWGWLDKGGNGGQQQ